MEKSGQENCSICLNYSTRIQHVRKTFLLDHITSIIHNIITSHKNRVELCEYHARYAAYWSELDIKT